jgi:putative sigma-54 modulation protein
MQKTNVNPKITVTVRHEDITDSLREYALRKISAIHLDYPKIIEAKAILDVQSGRRHVAEIILFCANHITLEASSETDDMYKSIDLTLHKITRRMRKQKTRLLKQRNVHGEQSIRYASATTQQPEALDHRSSVSPSIDPYYFHNEQTRMLRLTKEEAIEKLALSDRPFVVFENLRRNHPSIVWKKESGDYGILELPKN